LERGCFVAFPLTGGIIKNGREILLQVRMCLYFLSYYVSNRWISGYVLASQQECFAICHTIEIIFALTDNYWEVSNWFGLLVWIFAEVSGYSSKLFSFHFELFSPSVQSANTEEALVNSSWSRGHSKVAHVLAMPT